jgi:hypothetical protein
LRGGAGGCDILALALPRDALTAVLFKALRQAMMSTFLIAVLVVVVCGYGVVVVWL